MKKEQKKAVKTNIIPLADRVLIREINESQAETKTKSGIIIPVTVGEDKGAKKGEVVAVGIGRYEEGKFIPIAVKVGDEVLFSWGDKIKIDSEEFYIIRENEIIAVVK